MKKNFTINIPLDKFWTIVVPMVVFAAAAGMITGIIIVDRIIIPNMVGINKGVIDVPDVSGLTYENGRQKLYGTGLRCSVKGREYSELVPKGNVIRQVPEPGTRVKKGRLVDIVVSKGTEIGVVPDVRKLSMRQARIELKKADFGNLKVTEDYSEKVPPEYVIKIIPEAGTTTSREIKIELIVSEGPKPTHANVPNVIGETLSSAKTKIIDVGMKVGDITYKHNTSLTPGTVISQSLPPGASVLIERPVDLSISVIRP